MSEEQAENENASQDVNDDATEEGSTAKSSNGSKSIAKPVKESASKSKERSSKKGSAAKSNSKSGESSASKHSQSSKNSHKSKSKESSKKSTSQKSKENSKSRIKSKSKDKSVSKEKSKSIEKQKSNAKSKSTSKQVTKSKVSISKSKKSSLDMKKSQVDLSGAKIGFVGAGKMTTAIVHSLITYAQLKPKRMFVTAKTNRNLDHFKSKGIHVSTRAYDIFGRFDCDIVFLCMHGSVIRACFTAGGTRPLAFTVNYIPNQKHPIYLLSLIGGVSLNDIRLTLLNPENPEKYLLMMHRVMLNIGITYGCGMAVLDVEIDSSKCSSVVRELLSSLVRDKQVEHLPEQIMDTACVIGGNGLAFCYYFISALADGGFNMGLNKVVATRLAAKSLQIAAQSVIETGKHPSELQDSVSSSGGPAIYGINALDKVSCANSFKSAIEAAFRRLKELVNI